MEPEGFGWWIIYHCWNIFTFAVKNNANVCIQIRSIFIRTSSQTCPYFLFSIRFVFSFRFLFRYHLLLQMITNRSFRLLFARKRKILCIPYSETRSQVSCAHWPISRSKHFPFTQRENSKSEPVLSRRRYSIRSLTALSLCLYSSLSLSHF